MNVRIIGGEGLVFNGEIKVVGDEFDTTEQQAKELADLHPDKFDTGKTGKPVKEQQPDAVVTNVLPALTPAVPQIPEQPIPKVLPDVKKQKKPKVKK